MLNKAQARTFMVECQVRTNDVTDARITEAMLAVEREKYVPAEQISLAYAECCVEVKAGRHLLDPRSFGKLLQLAQIQESDHVLDVACATGYSTAVIATMATSVVALEEDQELAGRAASLLRNTSRLGRIEGVTSSHKGGAPAHAPFDLIFVNGAVEMIPPAWIEQLKPGGRLAVIQNEGPIGKAYFCVKNGGTLGRRVAFDATVPVLPGFERTRSFVF